MGAVRENIIQSYLTFSSPSTTKPRISNLPIPGPSCLQHEAEFVRILPPGSLSAQDNALSIVIPEIWSREKSPQKHKSSVSCRRGNGQGSEKESVGAFLASAGMMSSGTRLEQGRASGPSEGALTLGVLEVCLHPRYGLSLQRCSRPSSVPKHLL